MTDIAEGWSNRARRIAESVRTAQIAFVVVWLLVAPAFAARQELWVDETTQLSGLTLSPAEMVRWLAGHEPNRFGVPGDRMPPAGYLAGWLWSRVFGLTEGSLRALGVIFGAAAVAVVVGAAGRTWGARAAWVSGAFVALSLNAIVQGVEIRNYPLFLLSAALACDGLLRLAADGAGERRGPWAALTASCLLGCYSHFFGVVMSGGVFLAALWITMRRRGSFRPWAIAAAGVGVGMLALLPFIRAAVGPGPAPADGVPETTFRASARLLYHLVGGHPALSVVQAFLVCQLVGAAALLGISLLPGDGSRTAARASLLAAGSGLAVTLLATFLVTRFDAANPHYSLWMVPFLGAAAGSAVATPNARGRSVAWAAALLLGIGSVGAVSTLLRHGEAFAHLPSRRISEQLAQRGGPSRVVVVHERAEGWGFLYFPLRYKFGPELRQMLAARTGDGTLTLRRLPDRDSERTPAPVADERLVLIALRHLGAGELAAALRSGRKPAILDEQWTRALSDAGWQQESAEVLLAMAATEIRWFRKKTP